MIADGMECILEHGLHALDGRFIPPLAKQGLFGGIYAQRHGGHTSEGEAGARNPAAAIYVGRETGCHGTDIVHPALRHFVEASEHGEWLGDINRND